MVARCPACGARAPGAEVCRRCGCGLQGLLQIQAAAWQAERQAVRGLLQGDEALAREEAARAMVLDKQGMGSVLAGFVAWRSASAVTRCGG
ncbi:MAG: hypothetical protein HQL87_03595 [Magnetococcales bacterium]|nr:hypothetical protein [Magnetococcales bacterium]